jgi:hypothetical protein
VTDTASSWYRDKLALQLQSQLQELYQSLQYPQHLRYHYYTFIWLLIKYQMMKAEQMFRFHVCNRSA